MLALHPCQFGAGRGQRAGAGIAPGAGGIARDARLVDGGACRAFVRRLPARSGLGSAAAASRVSSSLPSASRSASLRPSSRSARDRRVLRLRHRGLGHAPVGFHAGLVGGRLRQRQFGGAARAFGIVLRGGERGAALFVHGQRLLRGGDVLRQPRHRLGGIAGAFLCVALVLVQPRVLPVEIGKLLLGRFQPGRSAW